MLGEPFDPMLAAAYSRCDGGRFGDFILYSTKHPDGGLVQLNLDSRHQAEPRLQKLFRYGGFDGSAYDLATIPSLAGPDGLQPVVYLGNYAVREILPIASNVDRAFDLYAHACEARLATSGAPDEEPPIGQPDLAFPYSFVDAIARDRELVRMLEEKRFAELFALEEEDREFIGKILKAARAL